MTEWPAISSMRRTRPDGSAISSAQGSLPLETSTIATSETCCPLISTDTDKSTSSPASASGHTLSGWLAGATIAPCGQRPAPANLSPRQAVALGFLTIATSGPRLTGSSPSSALSRSLGSRLQARTASLGTTLYRLTWKHSTTPAGRWISRLRASVRRTSDSDCIGWPTPNGTQFGGETNFETTLARREKFQEKYGNNGFGLTLGQAVQLAGWPTPTHQDSERGGLPPRPHDTGVPLSQMVALARGWAAPAACDARGSPGTKPHTELTWQTAHLIPGASLNGSPAETESGGLLNPAHSAWLQGIPPEWASHAPSHLPPARKATSKSSERTATRLTRMSRPKSSKP